LSRTEHGESGPDEVTGVTGEQAEVAVVRNVSLRAAARVGAHVTPGWLRSEMMLEKFGVTETNWCDACVSTPGFAISESPAYVAPGYCRAGSSRRR
jgi:hypothetical protein